MNLVERYIRGIEPLKHYGNFYLNSNIEWAYDPPTKSWSRGKPSINFWMKYKFNLDRYLNGKPIKEDYHWMFESTN